MLRTTIRMIATFLLLAGIASLTGAMPSLTTEAQQDQSVATQPAFPIPSPTAAGPAVNTGAAIPPAQEWTAQIVPPEPAATATSSDTTVSDSSDDWASDDSQADVDDPADGGADDSQDDALAGFEPGD